MKGKLRHPNSPTLPYVLQYVCDLPYSLPSILPSLDYRTLSHMKKRPSVSKVDLTYLRSTGERGCCIDRIEDDAYHRSCLSSAQIPPSLCMYHPSTLYIGSLSVEDNMRESLITNNVLPAPQRKVYTQHTPLIHNTYIHKADTCSPRWCFPLRLTLPQITHT